MEFKLDKALGLDEEEEHLIHWCVYSSTKGKNII